MTQVSKNQPFLPQGGAIGGVRDFEVEPVLHPVGPSCSEQRPESEQGAEGVAILTILKSVVALLQLSSSFHLAALAAPASGRWRSSSSSSSSLDMMIPSDRSGTGTK
ncbi:unnamed protein product [Calypogeia fissa]